MHPAIRVDHLSKRYRIADIQHGYKTFGETITNAFASPFRRLAQAFRSDPPSKDNGERKQGSSFWALKDVSFEVQPGQVTGIIGRNGAGKSTLLKVLSNITEPTSGRIEIRGRVGSLLEVGTGFHHELTGRENIYMNGSVLGMSNREIKSKFDEIVDFSEVGAFLDTPVKRYSSGMLVRLAFAVAAHLEPEILIIDEVLAVGDQAFQAKCLRKMDGVRQHGRTILFVSHNMAAVQGICSHGVVMNQGQVAFAGSCADAVAEYHKNVYAAKKNSGNRFEVKGNMSTCHPALSVSEVRVLSGGELSEFGYAIGAPLEFELDGFLTEPLASPVFVFQISRVAGPHVTTLHSRRSGASLPSSISGAFTASCSIENLILPPGDYLLQVKIRSLGSTPICVIDDAAVFTVLTSDFFGSGLSPNLNDEAVLCRQKWNCELDSDSATVSPRNIAATT